jgi:hypothetical protein
MPVTCSDRSGHLSLIDAGHRGLHHREVCASLRRLVAGCAIAPGDRAGPCVASVEMATRAPTLISNARRGALSMRFCCWSRRIYFGLETSFNVGFGRRGKAQAVGRQNADLAIVVPGAAAAARCRRSVAAPNLRETPRC